jgi:hypothetical protein
VEKHIKNGKAAWPPLGCGRAVLILFKAMITPPFSARAAKEYLSIFLFSIPFLVLPYNITATLVP